VEFYYFSIGGGSEISGVPPPSHGIFKWNSPKTMASRSNDKMWSKEQIRQWPVEVMTKGGTMIYKILRI
jgi:hypothetical protein